MRDVCPLARLNGCLSYIAVIEPGHYFLDPEMLTTVRFRCTLRVYRFLREGLQRYPLSQMRLSKPLPGDRWRQPAKAPLVLQPIEGDTHPFPIEIDLPPWTVARDVDFRLWLFG